MSHFVVLALIEKQAKMDTVSLEKAIEPLFEPYSENLEVKAYEEPCPCVGSKAHAAVRKQTDLKFGDFETLRQAFYAEPETKARLKEISKLEGKCAKLNEKKDHLAEMKRLTKQISKLNKEGEREWKNRIQLVKRNLFEKVAFGAHPLKDTPDPNCEECNGSGKRSTTYNPKSKWDWYTISGRWSNYFDFTTNGYDPETDPENWEACLQCKGTGRRNDQLGKDARKVDPKFTCNGCNGKGKHHKWTFKEVGYVAPVSEILKHEGKMEKGEDEPKSYIPFAILTKEGWTERGEMGWWASVSHEKDSDDWQTEALKILKANKDKLAVVVDCHI